MKINPTSLAGVKVLTPKLHTDPRGGFIECYHQDNYRKAGITESFVQLNHSYSHRNVLRGLHRQIKKPQGKLVFVTKGRILDVVVDINPESATFKQSIQLELSAENRHQLWIPPGYIHGFLALSSSAHCYYFCTTHYDPTDEGGIHWQDPELNIAWPIQHPIVSPRDDNNPSLKNFLHRYPNLSYFSP